MIGRPALWCAIGIALSVVPVGAGGAAMARRAPARASVAATRGLEESYATPTDARTIAVCWGDEDAPPAAAWTLRMRAGTSPPTTKTPPIAQIPAGGDYCYSVGGLRTNAPYTFLIVVLRASGSEFGRAIETGAACARGGFVGVGARTSELPGPSGGQAIVAARSRSRRVQVVYTRWMSAPSNFNALVASSRSPSGNWSRPAEITADGFFEPAIAINDRGDAVIAWNIPEEPGRFVYRRAGARGWGREQRLPHSPREDFAYVRALAIDNAGRLHFLVARDRLYYDTNATGRWTETPVAGCDDDLTAKPSLLGCDVGLMTYDRIRNRIVIVTRSRARPAPDAYSAEHGVIRIADKPANAVRFGTPREMSVTALAKRELRPTSVTTMAGQTTVALASIKQTSITVGGTPSIPQQPAPPRLGLYLMTTDRLASASSLTRIPSTSARDVPGPYDPAASGSFLVAATSRNHVVVAWQRDTATTHSWDAHQQGIWSRQRVHDPHSGAWRFQAAHHLTRTPYDLLDSLSIGYHSAVVIGFHR